MKLLIVIGGVILAVVICIFLGGKMVEHFQNELGTKQAGPAMSESDINNMHKDMEKKAEDEEWKYRRSLRNQEASFSQEEAQLDVPVMKEKDVEEAFDRKMTMGQIFSKIETWLTLGMIVFVGWMVYMRIRRR